MTKNKEKNASGFLHALPLPDVVHTKNKLLPEPELITEGRCYCCGSEVKHRYLLVESLPLTQLSEAKEDTLIRIKRANDDWNRIKSTSIPTEKEAQKKHAKALKASELALQHASLAARRLALRHISSASIMETNALSNEELAELDVLTQPFNLCFICHAWHALNGHAAAQGGMVWLPDLHPRSVVSLNRKALKAIFSVSPTIAREGRKVLAELMRHRFPVEERFGTWRPADFAEALGRFPPGMRSEFREKMSGIGLILTPDSITDRQSLM